MTNKPEFEIFPNNYKFYQGNGYHFTSDAIKLADFAKIKKQDNVLELCAGSGVISIYAHSKCEYNSVSFVEIQKNFCEIIKKNIEINNIKNATIINKDINDISPKDFAKKFDVVICNPPYEKISPNSNIQEKYEIAISRHEILVNFEKIVEISSKLIKDKGHFFIVHKADRSAEIINTLKKYNFECKEIKFWFNENKPNAYLVLIDAILNGSPMVKITYDIAKV